MSKEIIRTGDAINMMSAEGKVLTSEVLQAMETLSTGEVPADAVKEHPGKGGKTFSYISHIYVTQQLRRAFGPLWSMKVQSYQLFTDGAVALVTLILKIPTDNGFIENEITEVGAFDGGGGKMASPMMVASAVSRGLVKCVMRRFGLGEEFYGADEFELTVEEAWARLKASGIREGLTESQILDVIKGLGITRENIVDRYLEAWKAIYSESHKVEVPGTL
jgi:hypothetical protein